MNLKLLIKIFIIINIAALFFVLYQLNKNALNNLPKGNAITKVIKRAEYDMDQRVIKEYSIFDSDLGEIKIAVSFPRMLNETSLPILFILGGIETGLKSVKHVSNIGNNILVGFEWPINKKSMKGKNILYNVVNLYYSINNSPGQVAAALEWVDDQPWSSNKISLLGFSIGAIAAPSVQNLIQNKGNLSIKWTVLAYGGTNLHKLVNSNPYIKPLWLKPILGWVTQLFFNSIDPKEHLKDISGNFLIINGKNDNLIPEYSSLKFQTLAPYPKKIILLEGGHMGVGKDQKKLLKTIIKETKSWLKNNKAINDNTLQK